MLGAASPLKGRPALFRRVGLCYTEVEKSSGGKAVGGTIVGEAGEKDEDRQGQRG